MDEHSGKSLRHVIITGGAGFIVRRASSFFILMAWPLYGWMPERGCSPFRPCDMGSTT